MVVVVIDGDWQIEQGKDMMLFGWNWNVFDLESNEILFTSSPHTAKINCLKIHPDGHMLAFGDDEGYVKILQIVDNEEVASFKTKLGKIKNISFSENGYQMLVYGYGSSLDIWDLRDVNEVFKEISLENTIKQASFDNSGRYLLICDENFHFFDIKKFKNFSNMKLDIKDISVLKFGKFSWKIIVGDNLGFIKILG